MQINISENPEELGKVAGTAAAELIRKAIAEKGTANIILATGTSQFETLNQIINEGGIDWSKVVMFHLDEYLNLAITHPASFRKYLEERFISKVPALKEVYLINGETNPKEECERLGNAIKQHPIDVALVGIGENGHLAFNDPPADFQTDQPYLVVELDEACRKQQQGEGWFPTLNDVPRQAISMSVRQIMKSKQIVCTVPDQRKAQAVKHATRGPVTPQVPASILQQHPNCAIYLDKPAASLL